MDTIRSLQQLHIKWFVSLSPKCKACRPLRLFQAGFPVKDLGLPEFPAACVGSCLTTFRDRIAVPSSTVKTLTTPRRRPETSQSFGVHANENDVVMTCSADVATAPNRLSDELTNV